MLVECEAEAALGGPHARPMPLEVPCAFEPEATIWDHYELISRDVYVHHEGGD